MMRLTCLILVSVLLVVLGCGKEDRPLSRDDIFEARREVDTLYLTANGDEVIAPGNERGVVIDPDSGELAFPALQCNNPDCSGEAKGKRPYLFIKADPFAYVADDGSLAHRLPQTQEDQRLIIAFSEAGCPACETNREREKETPKQQQQYQTWIEPFVLPESAKRLAELDAAYNEIVDRNEQRLRQIEGESRD